MKSVSIVIPTVGQPAFLMTALQSVARQTSVDHIEEVVVSENSANRASRDVCSRFPELPIRYRAQDPPTTQAPHFERLLREGKADYVAILCDDDWWTPWHLQGGLTDLERNPAAVARLSAGFHTTSELAKTGGLDRSAVLWVAAGRPGCCETWHLETRQFLAAAWVLTPAHISSLIVRRSALQEAVAGLDRLHPYQLDRTLLVRLSLTGSMLYEPLMDLCVRSHGEALTRQLARHTRREVFDSCTALIAEFSRERGINLISLWREMLQGLDRATIEEVGKFFRMSFSDAALKSYGLDVFILPPRIIQAYRRAVTVACNRWQMYRPLVRERFGC